MQVGHHISTLDMTFKEPLVIKEAFLSLQNGISAAQQTTQKPWLRAFNYAALNKKRWTYIKQKETLLFQAAL